MDYDAMEENPPIILEKFGQSFVRRPEHTSLTSLNSLKVKGCKNFVTSFFVDTANVRLERQKT